MADLELLRTIFQDPRLHIGVGVITQTGVAADGSTFRAQVNLLPENREVVAEVGWESANSVDFPEVGDLAVLVMADGHPDDAFLVKIISHKSTPIPMFARTGNKTVYSRAGKKVYLGSDTKVGIGRMNQEPTEPLVLGNVLVTFLTDILNDFLNAPQIGQCAVGPVWMDGALRVSLVAHMNTYLTVTTTNILSQIGFTERGI